MAMDPLVARSPRIRRLFMLTMMLLVLWFSGPQQAALEDARARRRMFDPKANARSPGGWNTGYAAPARARRSAGMVNQRVAARRRPGRRG